MLGTGGVERIKPHVYDEIFEGRPEWEEYGKIGKKDKWMRRADGEEPDEVPNAPETQKKETGKKKWKWLPC